MFESRFAVLSPNQSPTQMQVMFCIKSFRYCFGIIQISFDLDSTMFVNNVYRETITLWRALCIRSLRLSLADFRDAWIPIESMSNPSGNQFTRKINLFDYIHIFVGDSFICPSPVDPHFLPLLPFNGQTNLINIF